MEYKIEDYTTDHLMNVIEIFKDESWMRDKVEEIRVELARRRQEKIDNFLKQNESEVL